MAKEYDYLIVGAGIYGATFACMAYRQGKRCLVIDKRNHLGGNIYCENIEGINVHKYGAHIFHTSNKKVWDFANSIVEFNRYTNSPIANYKANSLHKTIKSIITLTKVQIFLDYSKFYPIFAQKSVLIWQRNTII